MSRSERWNQAGDDALDILSEALDILKTVAGAVSVPGLEAAASILSEVVKRVQDARTNGETEEAFYKTAKELGEVITTIVKEANAAPGGGTSVLQERIDRFDRALRRVQSTAGGLRVGHGFRGWGKRFVYAKRNKDTLDKMNKELLEAREMFCLGTQGATENAVHRIETKTTNEAEEKIIEAIPHAEASYRSVDERKSEFMPGTRNETFGALGTWAGAGYPVDDPRQLFLLAGSAGLGKSAIAHQLCIRLAEEWGLNLGASFFFTRGGIDSAHVFFSTIAYQLTRSQPRLRTLFLDAARGFLAEGKEQQMRRTFEQLLMKPLTGPTGCAVFNETTFLVFDGIDECRDRNLVPVLLRCLLELVDRVSWLRIFVATRPEPHILPALTSLAPTGIVYHRRLDDVQAMDESKANVGHYLRQTLSKIEPYRDFILTNPRALGALIGRADGLFVYARIAVEHMEMYDTRPEEQFALLLGSSGVGLSPLDGLYLQVLQSAFPPKGLQDSPDMHKRLRDFLTFLALRFAALPVSAIALLLKLNDDDVLWMASRLRAVLLVDESGNLVPLHATFAEFLVDSTRCTNPLYHIDSCEGHAFLASRCLEAFNYEMVTEYLKNIGSEDTAYASADPEYRRWEGYSGYVRHWSVHLERTGHDDELKHTLQGGNNKWPIMTRALLESELAAISRFVTNPNEAEEIRKKHAYFRFYCEQWWWKMGGDYAARQAAPVAIANLDRHWELYIDGQEISTLEDHSSLRIPAEEVTKYTIVLQDLVNTIQESGTGDLWYDLDIGYRHWESL